MPDRPIFDYVPAFYRQVFPSFFHLPVPPERHATCARCAMVGEGGTGPGAPRGQYSPRVKCCTFYPSVPNYLVGALLEDMSSSCGEGRDRMRRSIQEKAGVTPRGVGPPAKYRALYRLGGSGFGRAESMVCPYYREADGSCSVWEYRTAQCSAYFCKFNRGLDGWLFWDALRAYLQFVEWTLASYALDQLGWDAEGILASEAGLRPLQAEDLDERSPDVDAYAAAWGEWAGREEELFRSAYQVVRRLDMETFSEACGIEHSLQSKRLLNRYSRMLVPQVPEVLIRNPRMVVYPAGKGSVLVEASIPSDPRLVRNGIFALLALFDGTRPWRDVVAAVDDESGETLSEGLVAALYQHRLLVDASSRVR